MDEPLHIGARNGWINDKDRPSGRCKGGMTMKTWTKPKMCEVAAGFEISRYLPAEITPKK